MEYSFYINNKIIYFKYYYSKINLLESELINNKYSLINKISDISLITYKYNIYKSIYIYNINDFLKEINIFKKIINENILYKTLIKNNKRQYVNSLIDLAAYSYCLSRFNNLVSIIKLDFTNINIDNFLNSFVKFIPEKEFNNIKQIYKIIILNYNVKKNGVFLYTDFKLNSILIKIFLENLFYKNKLYHNNFLIYKHYIMFFDKKKEVRNNYFVKLKNYLSNNYGLDINIVNTFNLYKNDVLFKNNVILENYSGTIKKKTIEFIKQQLKKKIYQKIDLSSNSEILLMKQINNSEFNIIKNNIKQTKLEYLQKIKFYLDLNNGRIS